MIPKYKTKEQEIKVPSASDLLMEKIKDQIRGFSLKDYVVTLEFSGRKIDKGFEMVSLRVTDVKATRRAVSLSQNFVFEEVEKEEIGFEVEEVVI